MKKIVPLSLLFTLYLSPFIFAGTNVGFNYWPKGYSANILTNANWTTPNKTVVKRDLDQMASLGSKCIRLLLHSGETGFSGPTFSSTFNETKSNLPELVGFCKERDMKVVIAFGNNLYTSGNGNSGHRWWMDGWVDFSSFLSSVQTWMNGFIDSVENSSHANAVLYYDYENEWYDRQINSRWYLDYCYTWTNVPSGKKGLSVMRVPEDSDAAYDYALGSSKLLDYVAFHCYPYASVNSNLEQAYDQVISKHTNAVCIIGELGARTDQVSEDQQQNIVIDIIQRASNKNIPYSLHWMLWDGTISPAEAHGIGWSHNAPKDVMGGWAEQCTPVYNPDMEIGTGTPNGWSAGSSSPYSFYSGQSNTDSATNDRYARVQVDSSSGSAWLVSSYIPAISGQKFYVNAYIRSNMNNITISIYEYDSSYNYIQSSAGPTYNNPGWIFKSYQSWVGPWAPTLNANTSYVIIVISGISTNNPSYLDVDCVSGY